MVGDTKIMPPRNGEGTAEVGRPHTDQLIAIAALREVRAELLGQVLGGDRLGWRSSARMARQR
jgi:hypothetical protein